MINTLELKLSPAELQNALLKMPNNKSPGPDGFPPEFYKQFWSMLSPLFYKVINEMKSNSSIPPVMNTAGITLLLKPNKEPMYPSSFLLKEICVSLSNRFKNDH